MCVLFKEPESDHVCVCVYVISALGQLAQIGRMRAVKFSCLISDTFMQAICPELSDAEPPCQSLRVRVAWPAGVKTKLRRSIAMVIDLALGAPPMTPQPVG